jgi:mono/diheme cytochrome c family protein
VALSLLAPIERGRRAGGRAVRGPARGPRRPVATLDVPTGSREGDDLRDWLVAGAPDAVLRGAATYDWNCAVCHGDTGLGYAEARLSFPADHRTCTRCHRPATRGRCRSTR